VALRVQRGAGDDVVKVLRIGAGRGVALRDLHLDIDEVIGIVVTWRSGSSVARVTTW